MFPLSQILVSSESAKWQLAKKILGVSVYTTDSSFRLIRFSYPLIIYLMLVHVVSISPIHFGVFYQTFSVNFLLLVVINFLHFTSRVISRANSYQLNDMEGLEKKSPKNKKTKIWNQPVYFQKKKLYKTFQDFTNDYLFYSKCGKRIFSFNSSLD